MTAPVLDQPAVGEDPSGMWALVQRTQAGDTEAFGAIYDHYQDVIFRFIYYRVGNRPLAEDLTSDTFLRALKRIGSFTWQGRDLGAWLVTIARNRTADYFKSSRYRLEVTTGDVLDADREDGSPEGNPAEAVVDHLTNLALITAIKQLNPEQQQCLVLRFLQSYSVAETAASMLISVGAVKSLQYRAVRTLARELPPNFIPGFTIIAPEPKAPGYRKCRRCDSEFQRTPDRQYARLCLACVVAEERFGSPRKVRP